MENKLGEFQVHTMGGSNISGNASTGNINSSKSAQSIPKKAQSNLYQRNPLSSQPKSSTLNSGTQSSLNKPFVGTPTPSSAGSGFGQVGTGGGSGVPVMSDSFEEGELSGKSSNKLLKIIIGVFIGIVLIGGAVFGVFVLNDKKGDVVEEEGIADQVLIDKSDVVVPEQNAENKIDTPSTTTLNKRYSEELLNYLMIDTESENVLSDIKKELEAVRTSLPSQNFSKPITFVVTNKQSKPISFSDFSSHANMNIPADILLTLEDKFELYAFNDFDAGVRFGFRVDVKNEATLVATLDSNASAIPPAMMIFFKDFKLDVAQEMIFKNGSYKNYAVKYLNLNEAETSSIDYIINDSRWILGTNQKTLRAIADKIDGKSNSSSDTDSNMENSENTTLKAESSTEDNSDSIIQTSSFDEMVN
ncbi:MAG: hypothetical protein KAT32_01915 [Candidatus Moranbacteria bacterium]|nr:hypothetical protein [Candidatus Moranbacteria bacterium]